MSSTRTGTSTSTDDRARRVADGSPTTSTSPPDASLLQDAASELLYPILPIFLTAVLRAPAAARGPRPVIGLGYGLVAVGKVITAVATRLAAEAGARLGPA